MPSFDGESELLQIGDTFTFQGWGTLESTGVTSNEMMEFDLSLDLMMHQPYEIIEVEGELNEWGGQLTLSKPCHSESVECKYDPMYKNKYYNPLQSVSEGDSGTPLVKDGVVYGTVSAYSDGNQDGLRARSDIITYNTYMDWFVRSINELTYPTSLALDVYAGDDLSFDVQNFTASSVNVLLDSGEYMSDVFVYTDCDVIASKEACNVTVSAPDLSLMPGEELVVNIQFTSEIFIPVTLTSSQFTIVDPDEGTPPTDPVDPIDPTDPVNPDHGTGKDEEEEDTDLEIGGKPTDPDEGTPPVGGTPPTDPVDPIDPTDPVNPDHGTDKDEEEEDTDLDMGGKPTDPDEGNGTDDSNTEQGGGSGGSMNLFTILGLLALGLRKKIIS
jgi:hypothetical protein